MDLLEQPADFEKSLLQTEHSAQYSPEQLKEVQARLKQLVEISAVPLLIALDGRGAVGKGTVKEELEALGYKSFAFGDIARVLSWFFNTQGYTNATLTQYFEDIQHLTLRSDLLDGKRVILVTVPEIGEVTLDLEGNQSLTGLRSAEVDAVVPFISSLPEVVEQINNQLRTMFERAYSNNDAFISEGRDHWKILENLGIYHAITMLYLTADDESIRQRAIRRAENRAGTPLTKEEAQAVGNRVLARNEKDEQRAIGRLVSPEEAYEMVERGVYDGVIDSSNYTKEETLYAVALYQLAKAELLLNQAD